MPGVSFIFGDWLPYSFAVWYPSWSAGALLFGVFLPWFLFISDYFRFDLLLFLPCATNSSGPCIFFSSSYFCFCFSTLPDILCNFTIAFLFPPAFCGPSGPSLHLHIFAFTSGMSDFSQRCCICFLGSSVWSSVGSIWTYFLFSGFINVNFSVVY